MIQFKAKSMTNAKTKKTFYYPQIANVEVQTLSDIIPLMEKMCTLTRADIKAVLTAVEYAVKEQLISGSSVRLGNIGSFRPTIKCSGGSESADGVTTANIKSVRCRFTPSVKLSSAMEKSELSFQKV